jgi:dihydrofolate reductase
MKEERSSKPGHFFISYFSFFISYLMTISLIVAASSNNVIGKNNQLLWHLPIDLKFFKNTTWAMPVIMGRKTFESVGSKPLPGRFNIVISRQNGLTSEYDNVWFASTINEAIEKAKTTNANEIFIAGGAQVYEQSMSIANRMYITRVHAELDGDAFFPAFNDEEWALINNKHFEADEKHAWSFSIQQWDRK